MKLRGATDLRGERTIRVLDAVLNRREMRVRYHSATSGRTKDYVLHPYRVVYADGGLYLMAFVPAYGDVRTFALERVQSAALLDTKFTPLAPLPADVFPHSLGVHSGTPERVIVEFDAAAAPFVREREWHPSQRIRDRRDGGVLVDLNVCRDAALRSWILSFGGSARVTAPADLAEEIAAALREGYQRYQQLELEPSSAERGPVQRSLPFPGDLKRVS
jgi:predicted DNA-binding transcriptional regulator YafY